MKKILLIGAGFIGTNFYKLFKDKYDITIMDIGDYPCTLENGMWDLGEKKYIHADIDSYQLKGAVETTKPDYIINMAASSHVDRSIHENHTFLNTNTLGVEGLMKAVIGKKIKVIQFSTDEVYGDTPVDSLERSNETDRLIPSSPYSASKAAADMVVSAYVRTFGVDVVTVRPTNNYGPYQYPEKLIPFLIKREAEGKTLPIYGIGDNIREWLFVEDCCRAVEMLLEKGVSGEIYNIGSGERLSNLQVVNYIGDKSRWEFVADRPGHDRRYAVNSSKIRALGWEPEINFEQGILITKHWYFKRLELIKQLEANKHI